MEASGFDTDDGAEVDRFWDQPYLEKTKDISGKVQLTKGRPEHFYNVEPSDLCPNTAFKGRAAILKVSS